MGKQLFRTTRMRRRGSTGIAYGLVVGLIAVLAIGSTQDIGTSITSLFEQAEQGLQGATGGRGGRGGGGDEGDQPDPIAPVDSDGDVALRVVSGDRTALMVTGPGDLVQGDQVTFELENVGDENIFVFTRTVTGDADNFEPTGDCIPGGLGLTPGGTCSVIITAQAIANGGFTGTLLIETSGGSASAGLAGLASGFAQTADPADPDTMLLVLPSIANAQFRALQVPITLTVVNVGEETAEAVKPVYAAVRNFVVNPGDTTTTCGSTLSAGSSCTFTIQAVDPQLPVPPLPAGGRDWASQLTVVSANAPAASATVSDFFGGGDPFPQPNSLSLERRPTALSGFDVRGQSDGVQAVSPITFDVVFQIDTNASSPSIGSGFTVEATPDTNVEIVSSSCPPAAANGSTCTATIRTRATTNGSFSATLTASAPNAQPTAGSKSASVTIAGTASGFD